VVVVFVVGDAVGAVDCLVRGQTTLKAYGAEVDLDDPFKEHNPDDVFLRDIDISRSESGEEVLALRPFAVGNPESKMLG